MDKNSKGLYTMIGEGSVFEGNISVPHSIRIDGALTGRLDCAETLTIGAGGTVNADVRAKNALIGGRVVGNLFVEDRVELESNSSLNGDLRTSELIINEGAVFQGHCAMTSGENTKV